MRVVVTGAAGFIGSHLCDSLLSLGDEVVGIDSFSSYYDLQQKRSNLSLAKQHPSFELREVDLRIAPLEQFLEGVDVVYHQAAQPGVRVSWAAFPSYIENNVLATQRLLEAARACNVPRLVYASSSSVYGDASTYPTDERDSTQPHSPYGVSKLAGEHLVRLYGANWGMQTVALRYFTVYGPRQRPDMAIHRLIDSALRQRRFALYGDGAQIRDFTFVDDVVSANRLASQADLQPGTVINVAGGSAVSMKQLILMIGQLTGAEVPLQVVSEQAGDVQRTGGSTDLAQSLLGWRPEVALASGLELQIRWHRSRIARG